MCTGITNGFLRAGVSAINVLADGPTGLPLRTTRLYAKSEGRDAEGLPAMAAVYRGSFGYFADLSSRIRGRVCCSFINRIFVGRRRSSGVRFASCRYFFVPYNAITGCWFSLRCCWCVVLWCRDSLRFFRLRLQLDGVGVSTIRTAQRLFVGPVPQESFGGKKCRYRGFDAFCGACVALNRVLVLVGI